MDYKPQHQCEAVDVDALAVMLTAHDLWRHVLECPSFPRHLVLSSPLAETDFTQAEVSELYAPIVGEHDVVWLEVGFKGDLFGIHTCCIHYRVLGFRV